MLWAPVIAQDGLVRPTWSVLLAEERRMDVEVFLDSQPRASAHGGAVELAAVRTGFFTAHARMNGYPKP